MHRFLATIGCSSGSPRWRGRESYVRTPPTGLARRRRACSGRYLSGIVDFVGVSPAPRAGRAPYILRQCSRMTLDENSAGHDILFVDR